MGCSVGIEVPGNTLKAEEAIDLEPHVGTYQHTSEDGADRAILRIWPERGAFTLVEWAFLEKESASVAGLGHPLFVRAARLQDGRLLVEVRHDPDDRHTMPSLVETEGRDLLVPVYGKQARQKDKIEALGYRLDGARLNVVPPRGDLIAILDSRPVDERLRFSRLPSAAARTVLAEVRRRQGLTFDTWHRKKDAENVNRVVAFARILADRRDPWGAYTLARAYAVGRGVEKNADRAREIAEFLVQTEGYAPAANILGFLAEQGMGQKADRAAAISFYEQAAAAGDPYALFNLARIRLSGAEGGEAVSAGLDILRRSALAGHPGAQLELARRYREGDALPRDDSLALQWYRRAAEAAVDMAGYFAGWMIEHGKGTEADAKTAMSFYQPPARRGYAAAQYALGKLLWQGKNGVAKDAAKAVQWFRKAASQDHLDAMTYIGFAYAEGRGVEKDGAAAVRWYRRAAERGSAYAMWRLGVHHARGIGVPANRERARSWLRKAVAAGETRAKADLDALAVNRGDGAATSQARRDTQIDDGHWAAKRQRPSNDENTRSRGGDTGRERASCQRRRQLCAGRICYRHEGKTVYNTTDGATWYLSDGRIAPKELWRDYSHCYE